MINKTLPPKPNTLPSVEVNTNGRLILEKRYLRRDESGKVTETPEDLFWRVAYTVANGDLIFDQKADVLKSAELFYRLMASLKFLPNSPCLSGAGNGAGQLFACFVLPIEDTLEGIFETLKNAVLIQKTGGGTGFSFSNLRQKGAFVKSTQGASCGPVAFMRVYDAGIGAITQGGIRLGANMGIMSISHPDIEEFITCKSDNVSFQHFNISVALTDEFMKAVETNSTYNLIEPHTGKVIATKNARTMFDKIVDNAWQNGDPGIIFLDRINNSESNMTPALGKIESTNPCGEQPLLPYESCVLGSINLSKFVLNDTINWADLESTVFHAVHFLDNVIDVNRYTLEKIEKMTRSMRRIGLGVMGFADMLIKLGIPYNSNEAVEKAEEVMGFVNRKAREASEKLAETRGAFAFFDKSLYAERGDKPIRNVARTTIAPTGTLSILAGCSSGIEPLFALVLKRKSLWNAQGSQVELLVTYKSFEEAAQKANILSQKLMERVLEEGSVQHLDEVPKELKKIFVTAHDITPEWHIKIQAAFQNNVNNAVSKTINFPHDATRDDVKNAYLLTYQSNCKGITIYRDGSRSVQVLTVGNKEKRQTDGSCPLSRCPECELPKDEELYGKSASTTKSAEKFIAASRVQNTKSITCCPECNVPVERGEGCFKCLSCGFTKCS